jgi:hypothetical protein
MLSVYKRIQDPFGASNMTREEKRRAMDRIALNINLTARNANAAYERMKASR